ncbi:MAG TPA: hypothetical protein ENJ82_12955, partial [Bacteroidetes bacterium]|nr:hypothetical protein [Bacteroidota bacterium]
MKQFVFVYLLVLLGFVNGLAQAQNSPRKCLTDELHHSLQKQYPYGLPGRTAPKPEETAKVNDFELTYVIPVVVHIMHDNGPELLVNHAQVLSQIDVLNEDYGRYGAGSNSDPNGAKVNIRFCLAAI